MNNPLAGFLLAAGIGSAGAFALLLGIYALGGFPECVHLTYSTCGG